MPFLAQVKPSAPSKSVLLDARRNEALLLHHERALPPPVCPCLPPCRLAGVRRTPRSCSLTITCILTMRACPLVLYRNWASDKIFPPGSADQATFSPLESSRHRRRLDPCRHGAGNDTLGAQVPDGGRDVGDPPPKNRVASLRDFGTGVMRSMVPFASSMHAKSLYSTIGRPSACS
jgi:hypothetical protein